MCFTAETASLERYECPNRNFKIKLQRNLHLVSTQTLIEALCYPVNGWLSRK